MISNLARTSGDPTLTAMQQLTDNFPITIEGAHRIFGFDLDAIREFDTVLNASRTHIIEAHIFERDRLIDLPAELAPSENFRFDAMLVDLVSRWQTDVPIRGLGVSPWRHPGAFYVHVGTEDSLGAALPPGSIGLVEPIEAEEARHPNPRFIYLLQFANGYRCSHCVVTRGKLQLLLTGRGDPNLTEFPYPGFVRIAGRIRCFAMSLPIVEHSRIWSLLPSPRGAELILPSEQRTRARLFVTKFRRFQRSEEEESRVREFLKEHLRSNLSERTVRRYRSEGGTQPHVSSLIHMTVAHFARYSDVLRLGGQEVSDTGRFSLEALLNTRSVEELTHGHKGIAAPTPETVWEDRRREMVEWPSLLSYKFPQLRLWEDRILRLVDGVSLGGLEPSFAPGSWLLLENLPSMPDTRSDRWKRNWSRPIYVLRRGLQFVCGYLERDGDRYVLLSNGVSGSARATFGAEGLRSLGASAVQ